FLGYVSRLNRDIDGGDRRGVNFYMFDDGLFEIGSLDQNPVKRRIKGVCDVAAFVRSHYADGYSRRFIGYSNLGPRYNSTVWILNGSIYTASIGLTNYCNAE